LYIEVTPYKKVKSNFAC